MNDGQRQRSSERVGIDLECKNYALSVCLSWSVDVVCLLKDCFDVLHDSDVPHNM